jgi:hypothetical protein
MAEDSSPTITKVTTPSGEFSVIPPRPKHWTTALPLWGIFGALVACTWFAAQLNADQKNLAASVREWMVKVDAQVDKINVEQTDAREWRIRRDTETAVLAAVKAKAK